MACWRSTVWGAALLMLGGCASPSTEAMRIAMPSGEVPANRSRLVLYRTGPQMIRNEARVQLNGKGTCGIAAGEALAWDLAPGTFMLSVYVNGAPGTSVLPLSLEAGKITYVEVAPNADRVAANLLAGPWGGLATANNNTPRGGALFIAQTGPDSGAQAITDMIQAGCPFASASPNPRFSQ